MHSTQSSSLGCTFTIIWDKYNVILWKTVWVVCGAAGFLFVFAVDTVSYAMMLANHNSGRFLISLKGHALKTGHFRQRGQNDG